MCKTTITFSETTTAFDETTMTTRLSQICQELSALGTSDLALAQKSQGLTDLYLRLVNDHSIATSRFPDAELLLGAFQSVREMARTVLAVCREELEEIVVLEDPTSNTRQTMFQDQCDQIEKELPFRNGRHVLNTLEHWLDQNVAKDHGAVIETLNTQLRKLHDTHRAHDPRPYGLSTPINKKRFRNTMPTYLGSERARASATMCLAQRYKTELLARSTPGASEDLKEISDKAVLAHKLARFYVDRFNSVTAHAKNLLSK